jgi:hypothetical protein
MSDAEIPSLTRNLPHVEETCPRHPFCRTAVCPRDGGKRRDFRCNVRRGDGTGQVLRIAVLPGVNG